MSEAEHCSVLFCTRHYVTEKLKLYMFDFPKEANLRAKWVDAIHREGFQPTEKSRVCDQHFKPFEIKMMLATTDEKTGKKLPQPRRIVFPVDGAIPSRWLDPAQLTSRVNMFCGHFRSESEYDLNEKFSMLGVVDDDEEEAVDWQRSTTSSTTAEAAAKAGDDDDDYFSSYADFMKIVKDKFEGPWKIMLQGFRVIICELTTDPHPDIIYSVTLNRRLQLAAFIGTRSLKILNVYSFPCRIDRVSEIKKILYSLKHITGAKS